MRVTAMLAGAALVLAACGGEKAAETVDSTAMAPAAEPAAAAPAATGTTHEVQMVMEGTAYKYVPAELTIKAGDTVVFKSISGGLHNVQFYPDSIPPSAASVLDAAITNKQGPLASALVNEGESITISFAGAPAGEYKYFCLPHQALGMVAKITVTE